MLRHFFAFFRTRGGAILSLMMLSALFLCGFLMTGFVYIIVDNGVPTIVPDRSANVRQVLENHNFVLQPEDVVQAPAQVSGLINTIKIQRSYPVTITADGKTTTVHTTGETVLSAIASADIEAGAGDIVSPSLGTPTAPNMNIKIERVTIKYDTYVPPPKPAPAPVKPVEKPVNKPAAKPVEKPVTKTQKPAVDTAPAQSSSGLPKTVLRWKPAAEALPVFGEDNQLVTAAGTFSVKKVVSATATAYYSWNGYGQKNASGKVARPGTIAVDPKVIPLGSRVYVVAADGKSWVYGLAVAEDTGVKGNIIDLYLMTDNECVNFGRRKATVYVLE